MCIVLRVFISSLVVGLGFSFFPHLQNNCNFISWVNGKCCLWTKVVIFHHLTFSFESKVADPAYVRPHVRVGPDVFFQHAGLLAADPALLTNVFSPASASDIHIIFVGFIPERQIREYS